MSVGAVAGQPTLLGECFAVRLERFGITFKVPEALRALMMD
jgi:hypothetical protein